MSVLGGRTAAGTSRRADIQGLRALAVLLVVAFHAGLPVPGGFMGVDVFFAISGFVITTMLLSELESSGGIDFPRFYLRRARRLLPALALMLSFVLTRTHVSSGTPRVHDARVPEKWLQQLRFPRERRGRARARERGRAPSGHGRFERRADPLRGRDLWRPSL